MSIDEAGLHEVEQELVALRLAYDRFFMRLERTPPDAQHAALKRKLKHAHTGETVQTRISHRLRTLQASLSTYEALWERKLARQEQARPQGKPSPGNTAATVLPPKKQATTDPIARAHAALVDQYLRLGLSGAPRLEEVRKHIAAQLQQVRAQSDQAPNIGLKIVSQDGVPTLAVILKS